MTPQEAAQLAPAPEAPRPPTSRLGILKLAVPLLLMLLVLLLSASADAKLSDKRLCFDKDCSVPISTGRTTLPYNSKDRDVLSFPPNTEVIVYSKSSGSRYDLWGVEIQGRRGYAPARFIRELKVLHSDLNYTVPVESSNDEPAKDDIPKAEATLQGSANLDPGPVQADPIQPKVPEDALNLEQQDAISADQVSPSYESVHDDAVPPVDIEDQQPPPSYSTKTVQEQPKEPKPDEVVRLDMYPNILSSTFSALSGILGSGDEATDDGAEVDLAENIVDQEAEAEPAPVIEQSNESNLQEEQNTIPKDTATEDKVDAVIEEPTVPEADSVVGDSESSVQSSSEVDSIELNSGAEFINESGVEKKEVEESKSPEVKVELDKKVENTVETPYLVDTSVNRINAEESLSSTSDTSNNNTLEEQESVPEKVQDGDVPKEKEMVAVDNLVSSDDTASLNPILSKESILVKPELSKDLTSVDSAEVQKTIILEVPLHQKVEEASSTAPSEPFVPLAESFQPNFTDSHSVISENINSDLTESSSIVKETTLVDNSSNLEKDQGGNDNIVDSIQIPSIPVHLKNDSVTEKSESGLQSADSSPENVADAPSTLSFGGFLGNRNLLNAGEDSEEIGINKVVIDGSPPTAIPLSDSNISNSEVRQIEEVAELDEEKVVIDDVIETTIPSEDSKITQAEENASSKETLPISDIENIVVPSGTCDRNLDCSSDETVHQYRADENAVTNARTMADSSETLLYVCITAVTTLLFSLGYYLIESKRRDAYLIGKINNLEKDLMVTKKECIMLDENFKSTKTKLDSIEDESFGSNEMVLSLKSELVTSENIKAELEEQIASLEKELESTSEAGLELERMLREILSSQSDENNPLAKSIEDLQTRLNDQQAANESLMNALAVKTQETETLTGDLGISLKTVEQLQYEVSKLAEELKIQMNTRYNLEQTLSEQVQRLESQVKTLSEDKSHLRKQLKAKELEIKELLQVVQQINSNNLDFEKLYNAAHIKAENAHLLEERDELKIKLSEEQGAHQLLEEHAKLVQEEVVFLKDQCIEAEKEKKEAETRLEVLTKFFEEKEVQRQKEEALWLEKQGDVSSTVDRLHTLQNEILNYKQQVEMLRREILDQEREYKTQIATLEMKAHEQWVAARQNERRLEEVKAESSQLRNRLTLSEKNINDGDPEAKLSRLQGSNGETAGGGHQAALYPGGEAASSSPLMFGAGSGPPLPPFMFPVPPPPVPFLPPPPPGELRPPPLGAGRLSSPPQLGPSSSSQASVPANHSASSPPPLSPPLPLMPFPPFPPSFASDHHHLPPPPLPPFHHPHQQHTSGWAVDEAGPPSQQGHHLRNSNLAGFQRNITRNHKGSLHSSGESLDKSHHSGKV